MFSNWEENVFYLQLIQSLRYLHGTQRQKWLPVYCLRNRYTGIILLNVFYPIILQSTLKADLKKTTASRAAADFVFFFYDLPSSYHLSHYSRSFTMKICLHLYFLGEKRNHMEETPQRYFSHCIFSTTCDRCIFPSLQQLHSNIILLLKIFVSSTAKPFRNHGALRGELWPAAQQLQGR